MKHLLITILLALLPLGIHAQEAKGPTPEVAETTERAPSSEEDEAKKKAALQAAILKAQAAKQPAPGQRTQRRVVLPPPSKGTPKTAQRTRYDPRPKATQAKAPPTKKPAQPTTGTTVTTAPEKENLTLHWKGSFSGDLDLDLELTGCGPIYQIEFFGPSCEESAPHPAIISITAAIKEAGQSYEVEYSLGARVAIKTASRNAPGQPPITNVEFRDIQTSGNAILKPGEPVTVTNNGGKKLSLMLTFAE